MFKENNQIFSGQYPSQTAMEWTGNQEGKNQTIFIFVGC